MVLFPGAADQRAGAERMLRLIRMVELIKALEESERVRLNQTKNQTKTQTGGACRARVAGQLLVR
jgi:hypothetical protein